MKRVVVIVFNVRTLIQEYYRSFNRYQQLPHFVGLCNSLLEAKMRTEDGNASERASESERKGRRNERDEITNGRK